MKLLLLIANLLSVASFGCFTWLVGLKNKVISAVLCSAIGCFNIAIIPLSVELASEITYPVGEANSSGALFISGQLSGVALTFITSALFDAAPPDDTNSAFIANLVNFILACAGTLSLLFVKGRKL